MHSSIINQTMKHSFCALTWIEPRTLTTKYIFWYFIWNANCKSIKSEIVNPLITCMNFKTKLMINVSKLNLERLWLWGTYNQIVFNSLMLSVTLFLCSDNISLVLPILREIKSYLNCNEYCDAGPDTAHTAGHPIYLIMLEG